MCNPTPEEPTLVEEIKQEEQKIIEENLKNLAEHQLEIRKQQEEAYQQLLHEDDKRKENPYGILFPSVIVIGTLLVIAGLVSIICMLLSMF